jgi:integrase
VGGVKSASRGTTGVQVRHSRACDTRSGQPCSCKATYQASVWSARDRQRIRKTFPTLSEAKAWRQDAQVALRRGTMTVPSRMTFQEAADRWLAGVRAGSIRNRSGDEYKPSAVRGYEQALRTRVIPAIGGLRLTDVRRSDLQDLIDRMTAEGLDPSTVRNTLMPVRVVFRRAVNRNLVAVNPTAGLELPAVRGRRDRIASPHEATVLLAALSVDDRALWATALYGGLRRGELRALLWDDVDLASGVIRVERSWDAKEGIVRPKSRSGNRRVPIAACLRDHLVEHRMRQGGVGGLVFGRDDDKPFDPATIASRADRAWVRAGVQRITLHECRHTFASLMIAAGVNAKALATFMGHASVTITLDRYGHLFPGSEDEAAGLLDAYLERANTAGRLAAIATD